MKGLPDRVGGGVRRQAIRSDNEFEEGKWR